MSTRKLIVASLICGLLIVMAGTIKLLQTANDSGRTIGLFRLGTSVEVGGVDVTVNDVNVTADRTLVNVTMRGTTVGSKVDGWSMLANGDITPPLDSTNCTTDDGAEPRTTTCVLEFVVAVGTPTVLFARDDERAQWLGK
ncbi:MAG: hypothetical protein ACO3F1_03055 [Ilumatobacteraceae bacterium]